MKADHPLDVLIAPVLSEESNIQMEAKQKYTFRVDPRANKRQIKDAIEQQWPDIRVVHVNTMNYRGKARSRRLRTHGRKTHWKKAVVTLRDGDSIELL